MMTQMAIRRENHNCNASLAAPEPTAPNLVVPDGIRLADLPPSSPELQPAEHLWPILDEPLANRYFATLADLERTIADRCRVLEGNQLSLGTNFHWWPKPATPS